MITSTFAAPVQIVPSVTQPLAATGKEIYLESRNDSQVRPVTLHRRYKWRIEDFIGLELTLVPEVECVFVEKDDERSFSVFTVINARNPEVRSRIYDREMAILKENPGIDFEFNILSRRNRPLEAVVNCKQKPYRRVGTFGA